MNLLVKLAQIPNDKLLHFIGGTVLATLFSALLAQFFYVVNPIGVLFLAFAIGCFKEVLWDHFLRKGTPDVWDAVATGLGAVPVSIALFVVQWA